jgi:Outer membrane protein beta-barrel domain
MKFLLLIVTTLLITLCATSQVEFNIFIGPQATTANYKVNDIKQETKMKFGFNAGAGLKVPFENKLFFAPVAFYSMKGYKVTYTQFNALPDVNAKDNNTTVHTFTLGALLQYDFNSTPSHFFIKAGPSLDFQLFGNEKFNLVTSGSVDRKMKFSFADYGFVSGNLLLQLGYETSSGFIIYGQYDHGLSSISNLDGGPQIKHRAFGISVGKYLNRKK